MDENPKRRKYGDNPYSLNKDTSKNLYMVSFKDALGIMREIEITKEVWEVFDEYERLDISEMNEFDRHTEHSEIFEDNLVKRANEKTISIEDEFIQKATFEELKKGIEMLPEYQKRRIKKYYFEEKNEQQIAEEEKTTQQAISLTLSFARNNLKNFLKNFQF